MATSGAAIAYEAINEINETNGHRYVGVTVKGLDTRRRRHFSDARCGSRLRFHNAIRFASWEDRVTPVMERISGAVFPSLKAAADHHGISMGAAYHRLYRPDAGPGVLRFSRVESGE